MTELTCRCCGKAVVTSDTYPIHTKCIPNHWRKHERGINNSRCKEFHNVGPYRLARMFPIGLSNTRLR